MAEEQINMMMSVLPGTMTGFAALNSGLVSINNAFLATTRAFDAQFGLVNTMLATTGVVVAQLGMDAMDAFGKFEQGMKIVQMVSGQTKSDIEQLSQAANQFSVQYRVDIDQITEGLQTLGRAGLNSATEQTEVLQNGLNTAKLEGRDLNGVLEELIQNTALLGGDLKSSDFGEQSEYVNDLLVATSMTAPITTHDVSETLKYSGGIAAAAGANIESEQGKAILEDYMGAIAAFAQKGVTGSIAGTALRAFFNKPATQDSSVTDALASIKLKPEYLWEDDEETMKPVSEQIGIITKQMDKLDVSTMDRLQIWSKIVGGKMGQQMMKLESDDVKELTKDIQAADDASDLAAGSMKTYEANVKALGESSEVLKRNVGGKLVFFANPILEVLNKITQFANQDIMSWPIAGTIIGFIGMLGHKLRGVLSVVKSEMATLIQAARAGEQYFLGKSGKAIGPNGEIIDKKADTSSKSSSSQSSPTTLAGFLKQYNQRNAASNPFSLQNLQKAGLTDDKIAATAHLSRLTKGVEIVGTQVPEGQLWAAALKHNLLTDEQFAKIKKAQMGGVAGRATADLVNIENVIPQIKQCEAALRDLGITASQVHSASQKNITAEEEKAAASMFESESIEATKQRITEEEIFREALNNRILETDNAIKKQVYNEGLDESAKRKEAEATLAAANAASAHATALGREIPTKTESIVTNIKVAVSEIEASFINMARNIKAFNATPTSIPRTKPPSGPVVGGYTPLPSNIHQMMGAGYVPLKDVEQRARELRAERLRAQDDAVRARDLEEKYKKPYIQSNTGKSRTEAKIDAALRGKRLENDFKEYDNAQAQHYKNLFNKHVDNIRSTYKGAGVGGVSGNLPTKEAVEASIKANEEAARQAALRNVYTSRGSLSTETSGMGRFGVGLTRDEARAFQDEAKRQADKANSITKSHPDATTSGMGRFGLGRADVREIQNNAKEVVNSTMRRVNDAVVNGASTGLREKGIVNRNDINKIREDSRKQWQAARNQRNAYSMPQSNIPFSTTSTFEKKVEDRLQKLHEAQEKRAKAGGLFPAQQQRIIDAEKQANQYIKGGWGGNQALSYYNLTPTQLDQIAKAEKDNWTKSNTFGAAFRQSFSDRINRDRSGSFLSFGSEKGLDGAMRSSTKGLSGLANKALNLSDAFGGPLMIAIMAVTAAIQLWQKAYQDYTEALKESENRLKEAYSNWGTAEDNLEQALREKYPDATDDEIEEKVLDTYASMNSDMSNAINNGTEEWLKKTSQAAKQGETYEYDEEADDGSMKIKEEEEVDDAVKLEEAIKENTGALYVATGELSSAMGQYVNKANDGWWGVDGWTGGVTDSLGNALDDFGTQLFEGTRIGTTSFGHADGSKFTDSNEFLLTASQKDENYQGYTEMAGLMLEDFKDAEGDWKEGLRTMMGSDVETLSNVISDEAKVMLRNIAGKDAEGKRIAGSLSTMSPENNLRLQMSMKNDQKTWKSLAKEIAKQENKTGKKVTPKNMTKKIEGLIGKLNASMGSNFTDVQIMQAAYLQQLQDMYEVAQNVIVPIINTNMQTAADTLVQATGIGQTSSSIDSSSGGTEGITSVIAGMVAQIAMAQAADATYNSILMQDPTKLKTVGEKEAYKLAQESSSGAEFMKKAADASYTGGYTSINWDKLWQNITPTGKAGKDSDRDWSEAIYGVGPNASKKAMNDILTTFGAGLRMTTYGEDSKTAWDKVSKAIADWRAGGSSTQAIYESLSHITQDPQFRKQLENAYLNSGEEEGDGSGGGNGSGSGDKDNDSGTRKERVDLVLCNRKTIPKLNVNLFKKPPSFTILNKNFKLRDVKINSEDKPKAIMAAIKNSFIDIQKRTDPKIIQDEDAVYDPAAATDGTNVPSGSAKTNTS